ncbi:hypothetical protein NKH77_08395 [Streptomyces sp. M19]
MSDLPLDDSGRQLLDQLFDKWSLLVLDALCDRPGASTSFASTCPPSPRNP